MNKKSFLLGCLSIYFYSGFLYDGRSVGCIKESNRDIEPCCHSFIVVVMVKFKMWADADLYFGWSDETKVDCCQGNKEAQEGYN